MSEFVKKTTLNYRAVPGGYADPECSHVILTKQEYDQIMREKAQAELDKQNAIYEADRILQKAQETAKRQAQFDKEAVQHQVEAIRQELETEKMESAYQRGLNENLLRISKERANADRKLKPKKEHTGYVVVSSIEKEHRFRDSYNHWKTVTLWETVLQSPHPVDFTEEQARKQMLEDLFQEDENGDWLIQKIGITADYGDGYAKLIGDKDWREVYQQYNVMLERRLKANYRARYWELVFVHTKALGVIPGEMRAR